LRSRPRGQTKRMRGRASNLALFAGVEAAYVAVLAAAARAPLGIAVSMFVIGSLLTFPLLPVYLWVAARIPTRWSTRRRRLAAIGASPILLALFAFVLGAWIAPTGLSCFSSPCRARSRTADSFDWRRGQAASRHLTTDPTDWASSRKSRSLSWAGRSWRFSAPARFLDDGRSQWVPVRETGLLELLFKRLQSVGHEIPTL
jgi:hypothetical protein